MRPDELSFVTIIIIIITIVIMSRICGQFQETVDHLFSGCPELAKTEYIQRHNKAAAYLHWTICKHYNIKYKINTMNMNQLL